MVTAETKRFFTCANCGETFQSAWSNAEAVAEANENWGYIEPDQRAVVCNECYDQIMAWRETPEGQKALKEHKH